MILVILSLVIGVILITSIASSRQQKDDTKYRDYLLQLDEMKKRKKERSESRFDSRKKGVTGDVWN